MNAFATHQRQTRSPFFIALFIADVLAVVWLFVAVVHG